MLKDYVGKVDNNAWLDGVFPYKDENYKKWSNGNII